MSYEAFFFIYILIGMGCSESFKNEGFLTKFLIIWGWPWFLGRSIGEPYEKRQETPESKPCPHGYEDWDDCVDCRH